jgi:DNA primase
MRMLKKFTRRIILALDPDIAGQKAILRGLDVARAAMDRAGELDFDARGLLRNEARLQADLRVVALPDNLDPDEIVARNRDEWANLIENAKPIVTFVMETLAAGQNLNDPKVKNQIAAQVLPLIEDLPNPLERDTYRQQLARMLKVDERALVSAQPEVSRPKRTTRSTQSQQKPAATPQKIAVTMSSSKMVEEYIVGVLFRRPELLYRLDRLLQQYGLVPLAIEDFEYTDHQMMFHLIRESVEQDQTEHHDFVMNAIPESLQGLSRDLIAQTQKMERDEKLLEELLRGVIKMRKVAAGENINQLRFLQEEAYQSGDWRASSYHDLVLQNTKLLRDLDQASRKMSLKRLE